MSRENPLSCIRKAGTFPVMVRLPGSTFPVPDRFTAWCTFRALRRITYAVHCSEPRVADWKNRSYVRWDDPGRKFF